MGFSDVFGIGGFDPNSLEPAGEFQLLPAGKYLCLVNDVKLKETKAGTGYLLEVDLIVSEGEYKNQHVWHRINIVNPNEVAQKIGRSELAALAIAAGIPQLQDEQQLKGTTVIAHVIVQKGKDGWDDSNSVRTYSAPDTEHTTQHLQPRQEQQQAPSQQPPPQNNQPSQSNPPWIR